MPSVRMKFHVINITGIEFEWKCQIVKTELLIMIDFFLSIVVITLNIRTNGFYSIQFDGKHDNSFAIVFC